MPLFAILLIAASALLHASWNLICKSCHPSAAFFLISTGASVLVSLPVTCYYLPQLSQLPGTVWVFLVFTGIVQALYYASLGNAYRLSEISVAYPLAKSIPVLLIPVITITFGLGTKLGSGALLGMLLVSVGCIILPLPSFRQLSVRGYLGKGFIFILGAALTTAAYTIIDSEAVRVFRAAKVVGYLPTALIYITWENILIELFLIPLVLLRKRERQTLLAIRTEGGIRYPALSGVICSISYFLVLLAMMLAGNVSYIAAFRQLSIPLGAVMGIILFKERSNPPKLIGIGMIFVGLLLVGLFK